MKIKEALVKIKFLIEQYYSDIQDGDDGDVLRIELVNCIEKVIDNSDIPKKNLIVGQLEYDKEREIK